MGEELWGVRRDVDLGAHFYRNSKIVKDAAAMLTGIEIPKEKMTRTQRGGK
jgi:hypothetical protein